MPKLNLLAQSYPSESTDQNTSQLINMYLEQDPAEGKYQMIALPTPGLTVFATLPAGNVRGIYEEHGITYAVGGNTFYSVASNGTPTSLGTLTTSTGNVQITGINNQIMIIDGTNGYIYTISTGAFATILTLASGQLLSSVVVSTSGTNYNAATTTVGFSGGGGSGAAATVNVQGGFVVSFTITASGSGYSTAPTATITDSSSAGSGATATTTIAYNSFVKNSTSICSQDEFFISTEPAGQQWQISNISDGLTWQPLNFASTTGNQNNLVGCASLQRQIWLFSSDSTEVWYNAGVVNFPFLRRPDAYVEMGCAAVASIAKGNNTLWFLGQAPTGGPVVCKMAGYVPQVISTPALNYQLSTYTTISDAIGFVYQQQGHLFYVLTLPTAGVTWVWDDSTQMWHQRQSTVSGSQQQWKVNSFCFCYNTPLAGDSLSGNIYILDNQNYTDNGTSIQRTLQTHPFYSDGDWLTIDRLQLDLDTTPGAALSNVNLFVSRSAQPSFGSAKPANPQTGSYGYRIYWNQLGVGRVFTLKIQTTMNGKFIILGAIATVRTNGVIKGSQSPY